MGVGNIGSIVLHEQKLCQFSSHWELHGIKLQALQLLIYIMQTAKTKSKTHFRLSTGIMQLVLCGSRPVLCSMPSSRSYHITFHCLISLWCDWMFHLTCTLPMSLFDSSTNLELMWSKLPARIDGSDTVTGIAIDSSESSSGLIPCR